MPEYSAEASGPSAGVGSVLVGIDGSQGTRDALDLWVTNEGVVPPATALQHAARERAEATIDAVVAARNTLGSPVCEVHPAGSCRSGDSRP